MNQKELIELVQQHHPHMGEVEIRKLLNQAQNELCEETEIVKLWFTDTTIADQRFYSLVDDFTPGDIPIFRIKRVELTDEDGTFFGIPRLAGKPNLGDDV